LFLQALASSNVVELRRGAFGKGSKRSGLAEGSVGAAVVVVPFPLPKHGIRVPLVDDQDAV